MNRPAYRKNQQTPNYFRFSRSQRRAMICLLSAAISVLLLLQVLLKPAAGVPDEVLVASLPVINMKEPAAGLSNVPNEPYRQIQRKSGRNFEPAPLSLKPSPFDPNTAGFAELTAFGLSEKAVLNIIHYREKGGRFQKPGDLGKIYALKPAEVEQLIPFVQIKKRIEFTETAARITPENELTTSASPASLKPIPVTININLADSLSWMLLPGIGAKRASSILKFREKLGGFLSVEQVGETFGLPDSVFQKIKKQLVWEPGQIDQLSVNHATEAELKAHPYIGWQWAKIIVAYRNQHGPYASLDDLMKIHIMKKEWLEMMKPYLKAD